MKWEGKKIYIRFLDESDAEMLLDLHLRNRDFFEKYLTTRDVDFYNLEGQEERIKDGILQKENKEKYPFGIFLKTTDELIGNVALSEVMWGSLQSCFIGYFLDLQHNGKGYMAEAVDLAVKFAFDEIHLHRIEAGVMPRNHSSMRVLEKAGFHKEGIAQKNVLINNKWEDHQVLAILNPEVLVGHVCKKGK